MPFDSLPTEKPETDDARWVREAMDVIRDRDAWTKGRLYCGGRHCMGGAVLRAMGTSTDEFENDTPKKIPIRIGNALDTAATRRSGILDFFWAFNDRPMTSHEDVMAVMQAAYETLRWGGDQ